MRKKFSCSLRARPNKKNKCVLGNGSENFRYGRPQELEV